MWPKIKSYTAEFKLKKLNYAAGNWKLSSRNRRLDKSWLFLFFFSCFTRHFLTGATCKTQACDLSSRCGFRCVFISGDKLGSRLRTSLLHLNESDVSWMCLCLREEKAIELYKQLKMKCKSETRFHHTFGFWTAWITSWFLLVFRTHFRLLHVSLSVPEPDVSSDSSEMVKAIIQTVQNQDKVLKDLYTHLRSAEFQVSIRF